MVCPKQPALGERCDLVDIGEELVGLLAGLRDVVSDVVVAELLDARVAPPAVGHDRRSGLDVALDKAVKDSFRGPWDVLHPDPSGAGSAAFHAKAAPCPWSETLR